MATMSMAGRKKTIPTDAAELFAGRLSDLEGQ
jgi:hypothetical protein